MVNISDCEKQVKNLCLEFVEGQVDLSKYQILYVESSLHKVYYHTINRQGKLEEYTRYCKLSDVYEELEPYGFVRTHQSFLVNRDYVDTVKRYLVTLKNGMEVNVSKKYYKQMVELCAM